MFKAGLEQARRHGRGNRQAHAARFERFGVEVKTQEDLGFSSDAKEAVAFALLGDRCLAGLPNSLPAVTGAANAAIIGKISLPPR